MVWFQDTSHHFLPGSPPSSHSGLLAISQTHGVHFLFCFPGKFFPQTLVWLTSSLHSGICSRISFSARPTLTALCHTLSPISSLFSFSCCIFLSGAYYHVTLCHIIVCLLVYCFPPSTSTENKFHVAGNSSILFFVCLQLLEQGLVCSGTSI